MTVRSTTITPEGRATRRNIELLVATVIAVAVVGWVLTEFGRQQVGTGPDGSAFVTDVNGTAALAELLDQLGHPVITATAPFSALDPGGTVFVIEPSFRAEYLPGEIDALTSWLADGGRMIVAGTPHPDLTGTVLPDDLARGFTGPATARIVTPVGAVDGSVVTGGVYSVRTETDHLVLAGDPPVAVAFGFGDGEVVYVADATVFSNALIDDNAAWVVSLVADGPARFDELRHGFESAPAAESATGILAALPERVRSTVLLLLPVLVVALIVYGRRFGPPEATERELAPPRRELVEAVAGLLVRMPDAPESARPVVDRLRATLGRAASLPPDAGDELVAATSERLGLEPAEVLRALSATDEEGMLAAQRLLARLSEREHT